MKAGQMRFLLGGDNNIHAEKALKSHRERLKKTKPCVDSSCPQSLHEKINMSQSPSKRNSKSNEAKERVTKQNYALAKRIFKIMEEPGMIKTNIDDTRHLDSHLGTMNYRHRLEEALLTHKRNLQIAARLDKIKGYYTKKDLYMVDPLGRDKRRSKQQKGGRRVEDEREKVTIVSGLMDALREAGYDAEAAGAPGSNNNNDDDGPLVTSRSDNTNSKSAAYGTFKKSGKAKSSSGTGEVIFVAAKSKAFRRFKFGNILLEYTKIQYGRVLDVVVLKQPFKDLYTVYGVDVSNGNLYEDGFSTEDVSNILDGDCIVTSADNTHVWKMMLNKVDLSNVKAFAANTASLDQTDSIIINNLLISPNKPSHLQQPPQQQQQSQDVDQAAALIPVAPSANRPSTRARGDARGPHGRQTRSAGLASAPLPEDGMCPEEYPDITAQFYADSSSALEYVAASSTKGGNFAEATASSSIAENSIASISTISTNATTVIAIHTAQMTQGLAAQHGESGAEPSPIASPPPKQPAQKKTGSGPSSPLKSPVIMPIKPAGNSGAARPHVHKHKAATATAVAAASLSDVTSASVPTAPKAATLAAPTDTSAASPTDDPRTAGDASPVEEESSVEAPMSQGPVNQPVLGMIDRVEGNYKGRGKWYPGKITGDRGDGTFDIAYDDGEVESRVERALIRVTSKYDCEESAVSVLAPAPEIAVFEVGDMIEGLYKAREIWYSGSISAVLGNGTYDIAYDDGEGESAVEVRFIRRRS